MSNPKIFVAGHLGMVGSSIVRELKRRGEKNIIVCNRKNLDLTNQSAVKSFFEVEKPDQVYIAAAKAGGIYANNTYPQEFIYENLMIQSNIIHSSFLTGVKKILFLGSSCIYPKNCFQPMKENMLLTGILESTNEPYAVAKISGIKLCESYNGQYGKSHSIDYRSIMPTNLYGPGDNYHLKNSHVIPSLIRRFHEAKIKGEPKTVVWGSGNPRREFLYVDDLATASIHIMNLKKDVYRMSTDLMCSHINVGSGEDIKIKDLAEIIKNVVDYRGFIIYDKNKPDGVPQKLLDSSLINSLGWSSKVNLKDGISKAYNDFKTA